MEINRYKLPPAKSLSHRYEMYSVGNVVNSYVIWCGVILYGDIS